MTIWFQPFNLAQLNAQCNNNMMGYLDIEFVEIGDDYLVAQMPVDDRTRQRMGILHGGASCVLAESVGSVAANCCVDLEKFYCVGLDINTNHIRPVKSGFVTATTKPFHLGKTTQVWSIESVNEQLKLVSVTRLTMAVVAKSL